MSDIDPTAQIVADHEREGDVVVPPQPSDAPDALEARETIGSGVAARAARHRPVTPAVPQGVAPGPEATDDEVRAHYLSGPQDNGPEFLERARLNIQNARYRGTAFGATRLSALAHIYKTPDPPDATPEQKASFKNARDEYLEAISDLAAYDQMPDWTGWKQFGAALLGTVSGSMTSPEAVAGWAARGATWLARTGKAALQQGAIQGAVDPLVQELNVHAGAQDEYHPEQTVLSTLMGAAFGAVGHQLGEPAIAGAIAGTGARIAARVAEPFMPMLERRRLLYDLGNLDPAFKTQEQAAWAFDPATGIVPDVARDTARGGEAKPPAERRYGEGPKTSFEDVVKEQQEHLSNSYGAAQPKLKRLKEDARWEAFQAEAGDDAARTMEHYGFNPEDARDLYTFYDREPGEHPKEAIERAIDRWYEQEERAAMQSAIHDSEWAREMEELDRHFESEFENSRRRGGSSTDFRGRETSFEGGTYYGPRGAERGSGDIPFESGVPARESGAAAEGRAAGEGPSGARPADEGGAARPNVGGREGERAAAVEPGARIDEHYAATIRKALESLPRSLRDEYASGLASKWAGKDFPVWDDLPEGLKNYFFRVGVEGRRAANSAISANAAEFIELVRGAELAATERTAQGEQTLRETRPGEPGYEDPNLTRFLDGDRNFYFNATSMADKTTHASSERMASLNGFEHIDGPVGGSPNTARVWYKPEHKAEAEKVLQAIALPWGSAAQNWQKHYAQGVAFGYGERASRDFANRVEPTAPQATLTERTAQGEQTLIPGVSPVTDRQRVEAEMGKPMTGGNKPPPAGGLFDEGARAQPDMFQARMASEGGPSAPIPPSPAQDIAIRSMQQQSINLARALDIPLREGRVNVPKAAGIYKGVSGVARVRSIPDFQTVVHEMGHAIEVKAGQPLSDLIEQHAAVLGPLDYDAEKLRPAEGFAEWMRYRVTSPQYAQRIVPDFAMAFDAYMYGTHPEIMKAIDDAALAYAAFTNASPMDQIRAVRVVRKPDTILNKAVESAEGKGLPSVIKAVVDSVYDNTLGPTGRRKAYRALIDERTDMERAVRELGRLIQAREGAPVALKAAENPYILLKLSDRPRQSAVSNLQNGVYAYHEDVPRGPSMTDALMEAMGTKSVWNHWQPEMVADFSDYLMAKRGEYLWRRKEAGELANDPVPFNRDTALALMDEMEAKHPEFIRAADMVDRYNRMLLKKAFDGGIIPREAYDGAIEHEFYVPLYRDRSDKPGAREPQGGSPEGQVMHRLLGSQRDILDPIQSIMRQTYVIESMLAHNDVIKSLVALGERAGPGSGKYVEAIPANEARRYTANLEELIRSRAEEIGLPKEHVESILDSLTDDGNGEGLQMSYFRMEQAAANGEPIVFYREGGVLKAARVMNEKEGMNLYGLVTQAPKPVADIFTHLIGTAASVRRAGITTNPTFMISNFVRDQMAAAILRNDYIPFVSGIGGLRDEFTRGTNAVLYSHFGGVAGGVVTGPIERAAEMEVEALRKKGYAVTRFGSFADIARETASGHIGAAASHVPEAFKQMLELASTTEAATRNSIFGIVYQKARAQGLSGYEAAIEAAFQAQDIMDFGRHGSLTRWLRTTIPFLNAHMQGMDKGYRTMLEPIIRRVREGHVFERDTEEFRNALQSITKMGALGAGLGAIYAAVMSEKDAYRDASPYFKGTHLVVPFGNRIFVIPKPFELATGFTAGEYAFHALAQHDPRAAGQFLEAAWQAMQPPNPFTDIPIVTSTVELMTGRSLFTGRDIVPDRLQRLTPEMQFTDSTSQLAKWLGKQTGMSPIKIEYAIGAEFGTWGRDVMAFSQGTSEDSPAPALDSSLFTRRFVKDPTRSSLTTQTFWKYMAQATGTYNQDVSTYRELVKSAVRRGQPLTQAAEFLSKMSAPERVFVTLKEGARDNGTPKFSADERRLHPLQRAYDAVTLVNDVSRDLAGNVLVPYGKTERMVLTPEQRRDLLQNVRTLAQVEMRNAFAIMGEKGYAGRPVYQPEDYMLEIRHISPNVADEIAKRYATAKIYTTEAVQEAWPRLRDEVTRYGTDARVLDLAARARGHGYEFSGIRAKKPGPIRAPIPGAPAAPAPNP